MGYAGKVVERQRARELRATGATLASIAAELGVSKSSVSLWVRGVEFEERPRAPTRRPQKPHPMHLARLAELERCKQEAVRVIGEWSDRDLFMFGLALYAGEGAKRDGELRFANTNPAMIATYVAWLRRFFEIDESRLRGKLYLHQDLDLDAAISYWSAITGIGAERFTKPYRAIRDPSIRSAKHRYGCLTVAYNSRSIHRRVMALNEAVFSNFHLPG